MAKAPMSMSPRETAHFKLMWSRRMVLGWSDPNAGLVELPPMSQEEAAEEQRIERAREEYQLAVNKAMADLDEKVKSLKVGESYHPPIPEGMDSEDFFSALESHLERGEEDNWDFENDEIDHFTVTRIA